MPVSLTLPAVSVRLGPTYATEINAALTALSVATHTGGANGDKWTAASLGVDNSVSWGGFSITALKATTFTQQTTVTTANSIWTKTDGNAYFTNGSGVQVQLTSGSSIFSSNVLTTLWQSVSVVSSPTIATADTYGFYRVDTSAARTITLPSAAAVGAGRAYIFQDVTGTADVFAVTIARGGADTIEGATSVLITRPYDWRIVVSTGSGWTVIHPKYALDLSAVAAGQAVVGISGSAGTATMRCDNLTWIAGSVTPQIKIADNTTTAGVTFYIAGQAAGGTNQDGGTLHLSGGNNIGTGYGGRTQLNAQFGGSYHIGLTVQAFTATRRVVAFHASAATTDVPTGDKVVYLANASTNPSSNPVGGGVLYVNAGALTYRGSAGTTTILGAA